jgi:hypothetical protein
MDISEITSAVLRQSPGGASCTFVKLDDKRGLKLYSNRREAVECRWRQRQAARAGLAPKVFGKAELMIDGGQYYGYISEVAEVVPLINQCLALPRSAQYIIEESDEFQTLFDNLSSIGLGGDLAVRNIGWINSKMVCIDFSWHSVCSVW